MKYIKNCIKCSGALCIERTSCCMLGYRDGKTIHCLVDNIYFVYDINVDKTIVRIYDRGIGWRDIGVLDGYGLLCDPMDKLREKLTNLKLLL